MMFKKIWFHYFIVQNEGSIQLGWNHQPYQENALEIKLDIMMDNPITESQIWCFNLSTDLS